MHMEPRELAWPLSLQEKWKALQPEIEAPAHHPWAPRPAQAPVSEALAWVWAGPSRSEAERLVLGTTTDRPHLIAPPVPLSPALAARVPSREPGSRQRMDRRLLGCELEEQEARGQEQRWAGCPGGGRL